MTSFDAVFQEISDPGKIGREVLNMVGDPQKFLKKSVNAILPVMLLLAGLGTIIYRVTSYEGEDKSPDMIINGFLVMAVLQLLPMAALKLKTLVCSDLISLMPGALAKTLMMHVAVLLFRMILHLYVYLTSSRWNIEVWQQCFDCISLFVALYILFKAFDFKLESVFSKDHSDVLTTVAGGCIMSVIVNIILAFGGSGVSLVDVLNDFGNYMEILSFVPVARIVCLEIGAEEQAPGMNACEGDRQKAKAFMAFILAFYFWDDLSFAIATPATHPLIAAGKAAHFVMLMDFTGYVILQVGAQPKILDAILPKVLPEAILQEVMPKQDPEMGLQMDENMGLLAEEDDQDFD